jgi:hypothetical protein
MIYTCCRLANSTLKLFVDAISILLVVAAPASAEIIKLHCKTADGTPTPDLLIDLNSRRFEWGVFKYAITNVSDTYITGTEIDTGIGGEIFVLDRVSGEVQRASVYMGCVDRNCRNSKLTAGTFYGTCGHTIL